MPIDYTALASTAERLIKENGRDVTIRSTTAGTYDPDTGVSGGSVTDNIVSAVFFDVDERQINDNIIQRGDRVMLTAAPVGLEDEVIDGDSYQVINVENIKPGSVGVMYRVVLRR